MIWIIYLIGSIIAFFLSLYYKKKDAQEYYDEYGIKMTNGHWLLMTFLWCILSWIIALPILIIDSCCYIWKLLTKFNFIQRIKDWWNTPILEYKKSYDND